MISHIHGTQIIYIYIYIHTLTHWYSSTLYEVYLQYVCTNSLDYHSVSIKTKIYMDICATEGELFYGLVLFLFH